MTDRDLIRNNGNQDEMAKVLGVSRCYINPEGPALVYPQSDSQPRAATSYELEKYAEFLRSCG